MCMTQLTMLCRYHCLQVAAGLGHCLAVIADGSAVSWGWNSAGAAAVLCYAALRCPQHAGEQALLHGYGGPFATADLLFQPASAP